MESPSPARWTAMQPALDQLLDLELDERTAFLVAVGFTDPALRQDLEQVLHASERAERVLGASAAAYAAPLLSKVARYRVLTSGRRLGPYVIERQLGQGGMATVYLALDSRHNRAVALEVLRPELSATLGAERFVRETAIAARLNHPNILPLFDSGSFEDGSGDPVLYFCMPFVEGRPPRSPPGELPAAGRHRGRDRTPSRGGAGSRPPAWHRAPGHQAGKRTPLRRARVRGRLRYRARPRRRGRPAHQHRTLPGHPGIHEPRAGDHRPTRRTSRSVQPGMHAVRDLSRATRPSPVPARRPCWRATWRRPPQRFGRCGPRCRPPSSASSHGALQGPGRSFSDRLGVCRSDRGRRHRNDNGPGTPSTR